MVELWTITPVANLEAVNVGWVIVRRATLHNYEELREKDIMIGDIVFIKRAWEVIPEVISVIKEARNWDEIFINIPEICPICESSVSKDLDKVRYYCSNHIWCPAQISWKISYQVWKTGLNIDWFWERQVELFIDLWFINAFIRCFYFWKNIKKKFYYFLDIKKNQWTIC